MSLSMLGRTVVWAVNSVLETHVQQVFCRQNKFWGEGVWEALSTGTPRAFPWPSVHMEPGVFCFLKDYPRGVLFHRIHPGKLGQAVREACLAGEAGIWSGKKEEMGGDCSKGDPVAL